MKKPSKKSIGFQTMLDLFKKNIKKIPWILGKHAFLIIVIFVLLEIAFGEFLLYQYIFLIKMKEPETIVTTFKENVYQSVLKEWQTREDIFKNASQESYTDPFL